MSRFLLKPSLVTISVTVAGLAAGYFGTMIYQSIQKKNNPNRFIASASMVKLASIHNAQQLFEIRSKAESAAKTQDEISTVKVIITPYQDYNNELNYSWELPEDARVISGSITGSLLKFEKYKPIELSLDVTGFSKEKRSYISFKIGGQINNLPVSQDILITSRPEDSFEYLVQQNAVLEEKIKKNIKLKDTKKRFDPKNIAH